jgi:hypothetical protein
MWSGPLAATTLSVPPDCGFTLLAAVGALDELLVEPVELVELGELGELEQAARPPAAMATTASAATRFDALGMDIFLLVCSAQVEGRAARGRRRLQR